MSAAVLLLLTGCASQGPLRPPSLHLPAQVRELHAERTGNVVELHWLNPSRTSDGIALAGKHGQVVLTAEICRSAAPNAPCLALLRTSQTSGQPGTYRDVLPPEVAIGQLRPVTYGVRELNSAGRGLQPARVNALAGAAPHPVSGLLAEPVAAGIALHWRPEADASEDRIVIQVQRGTGTPNGTPTGARPGADVHRQMLLAVEPAHTDPGGAVDTGVQAGTEQVYAVQRQRSLLLGAGQTLTMSSMPVVATVRADARPPLLAAPGGLQAVVNTLGQVEVALVWEPVEGAAGYQVLRTAEGGEAVRLTHDPVDGFTYTDSSVVRGKSYRYSVATVDRGGRAGPQSSDVQASVPAE